MGLHLDPIRGVHSNQLVKPVRMVPSPTTVGEHAGFAGGSLITDVRYCQKNLVYDLDRKHKTKFYEFDVYHEFFILADS